MSQAVQETADRPVSRPSCLPDMGDFIVLIVFLFQLRLLPNYLLVDGSTGWHLDIGQFVLKTGSVPHQDFISYTFAGQPLPW